MVFQSYGKKLINTICLADGQWGSTSFNQEVYDRIKEEMIDPEDDGKRDYIVNMQWARERIHNMAEKDS